MKSTEDTSAVYAASAQAKTGGLVPLFADGKPANSLYNPEREAEKAAARFSTETFAVFTGLADGRRVKLFLEASPANECIVIEKNSGAFQFLERFPAAASVMQNRRARLFSFDDNRADGNTQGGGLKVKMLESYIPALFRQFSLDILPSWQAHFPAEAERIKAIAEEALAEISADFSAQARFGKIWMLNAAKNLFNAAKAGHPSLCLASLQRDKKALVAAAGPSLDDAAPKIKEEREGLAIFAADTALPALAKRGIAADFALSIDPQAVSARHFASGFGKGGSRAVLIMDICASSAAAEKAKDTGHSVVFAAGRHPLSLCMASFAPLPRLETRAGTVTASALDAAKRLGFREIQMAGADFAFTGGKPYCRGTYLEDEFYRECTRTSPAETMYARLMFRGPVKKKAGEGGTITYKTELLERYKKAVEGAPRDAEEWGAELEAPFPYKGFLFFFRDTLRALDSKLFAGSAGDTALLLEHLSETERNVLLSILPLVSYYRRKEPRETRQKILKSAINLALNAVERYTKKL